MSAKPKPDITSLNAPFWDGTGRGELRVQHCRKCDARFRFTHFRCPECWSDDLDWQIAKGTGVVATFSVVHVAPFEAFADRLPYVLALIDLDEGVRMMANIVDCEPNSVTIGMPVEVLFEDRDGIALPQYRPVDSAGARP